ncbi:hypothetical protein SERLA73DRAFT_111009 [Serpula lacrymans var. lacrymans S7.3]|uniref:Cytochrome P450 n=2 Tax=Serpula lacrymans var. lacrymans TaxID=341189 RepID=F8Q3B9_SERL3|nr:uncharacterized protein SERLADRAFT_440011 [Serpula lacrymans var. lacrymans S7.9]EGN97680.1 hypothetical protein SERLA73DRAFT_111009 [Serpula lacrymans var. lacrymans S7.3]EGO23271.1 hypothetical protein SERLADRAFT_440011 [Serpula lacrymans var. lacrymans S7.9]
MLRVLIALVTVFIVSRLAKLRSGLKAVDHLPGLRCAFTPISGWGFVIPTSLNPLLFNPGSNFFWSMKFNGLYPKYDIISIVPWLQGPATIFVSSVEMMRQIIGRTDAFDKLTDSPGVYLFGENVASLQREGWKKHRRILNPAFSPKLYNMVWNESIRIFHEMATCEGEWKDAPVADVTTLTARFALMVVSSCAYDFRFTWSDPLPTAASGGEKTIRECFDIALNSIPIRLLAPRWAYSLPSKMLRRVDYAFNRLTSFSKSQVALRREQMINGTMDNDNGLGMSAVFNTLVRAGEDDGRFALSEREVVGNTFTMLFAGHETTARALSATLAMLSLHQDEQERVYQEITRVLPDGREPAFEDFDSFTHTRNCFTEAMRLYPPASVILREAMQDAVLSITDRDRGKKVRDVIIKKGTLTCIDVIGIHYNPRYFPDPEIFEPSRWEDSTVNTDAFVGFGHGPRVCIGDRFSIVESICFLVMLLRTWKVEVNLLNNETLEQWRQRVLTGKNTVTLCLGEVSLKLTKRS